MSAASHIPSFAQTLSAYGHTLRRTDIRILQVNLGKLCNQACHHCHVEAGPKRRENMSMRTVQRLLALIDASATLEMVDLTGGAPELNPNFRYLVMELRTRGIAVMDRCNLTVLEEPGQEDLADFLTDQQVQITASLPCYSAKNVDAQRGNGVFAKSIRALQALNQRGYGQKLPLYLVYNPLGASLPPAQEALEAEYRTRLNADYGIVFSQLFALTNMPIKRFAHQLQREGKEAEYLQLLLKHFNPHAVDGVMCRSLVSIGHDGQIYDCDFNQMLEIPVANQPLTLWEIERLDAISHRIATDTHCYGCTAGAGSSCSGAVT